MIDGLTTLIDTLDLGVERYGNTTHIVDSDGVFTTFFCGKRGVRIRKRSYLQKPSCRACVAEARRLEIGGV